MTTVTVKSSGGDYTTLQAAIDACPADITPAGTNQTWEIECYASVTGTANITVAGKTTDATHFIRIYTPQAERHNGISGGFAIEANGFLFGVSITSPDVKLEGIRFISGTNANGAIRASGAAARRIEVSECLFASGGATYGGINIIDANAGTIKVRNCIWPNTAGQTAFLYLQSGSGYSCYAYNNTARTTQTAGQIYLNAAGVSAVAKNCIATGAGSITCFSGTWNSGSAATNNVSTDSTAPGSNPKTSSTPSYVDAANGDLHLAAGDTVAKDSGVDLSADANFPFSIDIDGQTRSGTWDIGADEIAASAIDLAGAAAAAATGQGALTQTQALAAAAVAAALGSGALSVNAPLTGAAIASAVGSAALDVFTNVWRIPTDAVNGTVRHVIVLDGTAPNYTVLVQAQGTVAGGYLDIPAPSGSPGTKRGAVFGNYNDDPDTVSIYGGWGIATITTI